MATKALLTVEQFAQMPDDERGRFELVEGELIPVPSATPRHARIKNKLLVRLTLFVDERNLGEVTSEVDCRTREDSVRRPDVSYYAQARLQLVNEDEIPVPFPPDIAIEVLSRSEHAIDVNRKTSEYLAGGAREVWVVDWVNREIHVRTAAGIRLLGAEEMLESPLLPGFSVRVADVVAGT